MTISTTVAYLIDTNVLVYRFDARFPEKQERATALLERGIVTGDARIAHQAVVEFVAAVTRPLPPSKFSLLARADALQEAEGLMSQLPVLYPTAPVLRLAIRGVATYQLSWFDANMWAVAEHHGLSPLYTEDMHDGAVIGTVRITNPFA